MTALPTLIKKLDSEIAALSYLNMDKLAVATVKRQVHIIDINNKKSEKVFEFASLNQNKKKLTFSKDANYLAYAQDNFIHLVDLKKYKLIHRIEVDAGNIEILHFNDDASYLMVGTVTGRILLWQREHHEMLSRLTSFPEYINNMMPPLRNYVSSIATYKHLIASSGYGDSIVVINYITGVIISRIYPGRSRINSIVFLDEFRLLIANEDGKIVKLFINENQPHHQVSASIGAIKHLLVLGDNTFALAASSHKSIALINIQTMKVIDSEYIVLKDKIVDMIIGSDMLLYIGVKSGEVYSSKLMPVHLLKTRIKNQHFELAYKLVEDIPILKISSWYYELEDIFSQYYKNALKYLLIDEQEEAKKYTQPFLNVVSKKKIIQDLYYAFNYYERLCSLLENLRLAPAYGLVEEFPALKMTPEFQNIEKRWEDSFEEAQKLIIKNREEEAKTLLKPFSVVSSKATLINLLFKVSTDIVAFSKAIASYDYKALHVITKQYPALKMMPSHINAIEEIEGLIEQIMEHIKEDRFEDAQISCEFLLEVPHLQKNYEHMSQFIDKAKQLYNADERDDLCSCFEILDSFIELTILPRAKILESKWQKMITTCENSALKSDVKDIILQTKKFMPLYSRQEKIGSLFRLAYLIQLKSLDKNDKKLIIGIEQYLRFFGGDSELVELLKEKSITMNVEWFSREHWLQYYEFLPFFIYETI